MQVGGKMGSTSLTRRIVNELEGEILSGRLGPHEHLVEQALSARFGVSRTPIREAIRILEAKGLIVTRGARGAEVREISSREIEDFYAVRAVLEDMAMELAADRLDRNRIKRIERKLHAMRQAARRNEVRAYFEADMEFHALIFGACGNAVLIDLLSTLERRVEKFRLALLSLPGRLMEAQRYHEAVFDALRQGNGKLAGKVRRRRIENSKALLVNFFQHFDWGYQPTSSRQQKSSSSYLTQVRPRSALSGQPLRESKGAGVREGQKDLPELIEPA